MNIRFFLLLSFFVVLLTDIIAQSSGEIRGTVVSDTDELPLPGASVRLQFNGTGTTTDTEGRFTLVATGKPDTLVISFIGFDVQKMGISGTATFMDAIRMKEKVGELAQVIATGYQLVSPERVTGSYAHIHNELLNRRVSTNLLDRLEDITPGLVFNRNVGAALNPISIRGQSTIFGNANPLIVIDNFPYEGELSNINPNDVESITVLKDAAAASIWGTKAGNGVIVITTKKGRQDTQLHVDWNANVQIGNQPDQFYQPAMSVNDFIEMEKTLFARGYYQSSETSRLRYGLTPVVEVLIAQRDGLMDKAQADKQIEYLKTLDVRKDYEKYFYRPSVAQQYSLGLSGGTENYRFNASIGRDQGMASLAGSSNGRTTLNMTNRFTFFKQKIRVSIGGYYTQTNRKESNLDPSSITRLTVAGTAPIYPYAQLAGENGEHLPVIKDFRLSYLEQAERSGLLNWYYVPLDELALAGPSNKGADYRLNASMLYKITNELNLETLLQYGKTTSMGSDLKSSDHYFTRNLINRLTQIDAAGNLIRPVPAGGILDNTLTQSEYKSFRTQFSYNKLLSNKHHLTGLAGFEARDYASEGSSSRLYGYDPDYETSKPVDYISTFPLFVNPSSVNNTIPYVGSRYALTDHYLSYYSNLSYAYAQRYVLTASARLDQSNLFGVESNQKGVPLWSTGVMWNISHEPFYQSNMLPYLRARFTFGYNGNINKSVSAFTTARFSSSVDSKTRLPYLTIVNPPNPALRWERVRMMNAGIDFDSRGGRIGGSVEFYFKQAIDLIGNISLPPSSGMESYIGNTATVRGSGVDLILNTQNIKGVFTWHSTFILSRAAERVTDYTVKSAAAVYISSGSGAGIYPLSGRPLYTINSYAWAGLDPASGDPLGYLEGKPSNNYSQIVSNTTPETMVYHGPARPLTFGAFRNTIAYKGISLSVNVTYRLGYYFRRSSVNYSSVLRGQGGHGDFSNRWQRPGDELVTAVPSLPAAVNGARDNFYLFSSALVEKGDHVRLQDASLSFDLKQIKALHTLADKAQVYVYVNNIGLLWKANKKGLDPDYHLSFPPPRTVAIGFRWAL